MKQYHWMAAMLVAWGVPAMAQDVVVMGDSLSDIGQQGWALKATYAKSDGSLNSLYNESVAKALGSTLVASSKGGTNYAYSGGVVVGSNSTDTATEPNVALQKQVNDYVAAGVKPQALHILWGGGNDMAAILTRAQAAPSPTMVVLADTATAAQASAAQWQTLKQAGVSTVVAPTVPNVLYTPTLFRQFGRAAAAGLGAQVDQVAPGMGVQATAAFNQAFEVAQTKLNTSQQQSMAEFDALRTQVLSDTVDGIYLRNL